MPRRRGIAGPPRFYATAWPDGEVDGPVVAQVARAFVLKLRVAMGDRGVRDVARAADLDHTTLMAILAGEAWPDLATIAKLEATLEADLWPGRSVG